MKDKIKSLIPGVLLDLMKEHNAFIAGGFLLGIYDSSIRNTYSDIDIFFYNENDFISISKCGKFNYISETDKAVLCYLKGHYTSFPIHLIRKTFGTPKEIIDSFDITICMIAYYPKEDKFFFGDSFLNDVSDKKLIFTRRDNPIAVASRLIKYENRGYSPDPSEILRLLMIFSSVDPEELAESYGYSREEYYKGVGDWLGEGNNNICNTLRIMYDKYS